MRMKDRIIALFYRLVCILKSVCSRNKGQTSIQQAIQRMTKLDIDLGAMHLLVHNNKCMIYDTYFSQTQNVCIYNIII